MRYLVSVLILLSIPATSFSNCVQWILCPYLQGTEEEEYSLRYLPISDAKLGFEWKEIEVLGGRALICTMGIVRDTVLLNNSCSLVDPLDLESLLVPPNEVYYDKPGKRVREFDGRDGREKIDRGFNIRTIKRGIQDDNLTSKSLSKKPENPRDRGDSGGRRRTAQ